MKFLNCIAVFNEECTRMLMCVRRKDPYKGLSNLVGGKVEPGEDGMDAAYRELWEETAITRADIKLTHLLDFTYWLDDTTIEIYVGRLNKKVSVYGDENELYWSELDCNFFDKTRYAGEGNIGHIMEHIRMAKDKVLAC